MLCCFSNSDLVEYILYIALFIQNWYACLPPPPSKKKTVLKRDGPMKQHAPVANLPQARMWFCAHHCPLLPQQRLLSSLDYVPAIASCFGWVFRHPPQDLPVCLPALHSPTNCFPIKHITIRCVQHDLHPMTRADHEDCIQKLITNEEDDSSIGDDLSIACRRKIMRFNHKVISLQVLIGCMKTTYLWLKPCCTWLMHR